MKHKPTDIILAKLGVMKVSLHKQIVKALIDEHKIYDNYLRHESKTLLEQVVQLSEQIKELKKEIPYETNS